VRFIVGLCLITLIGFISSQTRLSRRGLSSHAAREGGTELINVSGSGAALEQGVALIDLRTGRTTLYGTSEGLSGVEIVGNGEGRTYSAGEVDGLIKESDKKARRNRFRPSSRSTETVATGSGDREGETELIVKDGSGRAYEEGVILVDLATGDATAVAYSDGISEVRITGQGEGRTYTSGSADAALKEGRTRLGFH